MQAIMKLDQIIGGQESMLGAEVLVTGKDLGGQDQGLLVDRNTRYQEGQDLDRTQELALNLALVLYEVKAVA